MTIFEIIFNVCIVSIPEEFFMVFICLILLGRYDYIDSFTIKKSIKKVFFIAVLPLAIISNYMLLEISLNLYFRSGINILILAMLVFILTRDKFRKVVCCSVISYGIVLVIELLGMLILTNVFKFNLVTLNTNPWTNFVMTLPGRLVEFGIIYMIYLKKNAFISIKALKIWKENKMVRNFVIVSTFINIIMALFIYNNFVIKRYVEALTGEAQFYIVMLIFILFVLNIICPYILIFIIYTSENQRKKLILGGDKNEKD